MAVQKLRRFCRHDIGPRYHTGLGYYSGKVNTFIVNKDKEAEAVPDSLDIMQ